MIQRISLALLNRTLNPLIRAFAAHIHKRFRSGPLLMEIKHNRECK